MNQLKHIVHSLPRQAAAPSSNAISAVSSGYQIDAQSIFRHGSDFLRGSLPSNRPSASQSYTGYGQTLLRGKPKIALTCCRHASTDRVGHPNNPLDHKKSNDNIAKAEVASKKEKRAQPLAAVPEPRNYAKLIADYCEAMEKENSKSKSKELPTGLLSRLPIESLVSSLSPFEKNRKIFKGKLKKRDGVSEVVKSNAKQSDRALAKSALKTEKKKGSAAMKSATQKRDYVTKNCDAEKMENKIIDANGSPTSSVLMSNAYIPNDFDVFCNLTEKSDQRDEYPTERSDSAVLADHKVKDLRNLIEDFGLSDSTLNNNQCQFNIVASEKEIELRQPSASRLIVKDQAPISCTSNETNIPNIPKSTYKYNQKNNPLPWWTTPDSILNEKFEIADRALSYSTPEVQVIYSEEMSNADIAKRIEKHPRSLHNSKLEQHEKLANLSKTKQYSKEEFEKHKNKQRRKRLDRMTNIDGKPVEEGKIRSTDERPDDKNAKLGKIIEWDTEAMLRGVAAESGANFPAIEAAHEKSEENSTNNGLPEASGRAQNEARKSSIDQEYRMKRVTEPLKPLEKKKDGTLIDYGLKVPTRRPKNRQQPVTGEERNPEKKNSAPHQQQQQVDSESADCSIPRQITSSSQQEQQQQQQSLNLGKSDENRKNNNDDSEKRSSDLRRSNCSGEEAITDRLVNSLQQQQQQLRSEQMLRPAHRDSCHYNCRLHVCAADSTISVCEQERPEKQLIYAAWLNRFHTPRRLFF